MYIGRFIGISMLCLFLNIHGGVSQGAEIGVDCESESTLVTVIGGSLHIVCTISNLNNNTVIVYWAILRNSVARRIFPSVDAKYNENINTVSNSVTKATLSIKNAEIQDEGKYLIDLNNIGIQTSVNVVIEGKPRITNQFTTIYGRPDYDLLLDCRVQSWPPPSSFKWYYNNRLLRYDSQHQIYERVFRDRDISHTYLKILKFNTSHIGTYICAASNKFGDGELTLEARVGKNESVECKIQYKCNSRQTCDLDHGCLCMEGYREQADGSCRDIDECFFNIHDCEQVCTNIEASYTCSCNEGYVMDKEGKTCSEFVEPPKPSVNNTTLYAIIGIVMAFIVIVVILILVFILRRRHKKMKSATPPPQFLFEKSATPATSIVHEFSVNKVEMQHEIGKGRFGKVYLARAWDLTGTGAWEPVAVKQSRQDLAEEDKSAFLHELNLVKKIPYNRNIVRWLGYFYEPMMSMLIEYMPYGDLLTYLRQKRPQNFKISNSSLNTTPLTASHLFNFALQCAKGMQHLHENKIIHRDLAARNILVANENCCKISDFGMARKVGENYCYTSRSKRPLPILWMAPEAIFNDLTSNKSDVWSYGVVFWEMITLGSRPYPGKSGPQVLHMLQRGERMNQPLHCATEIHRILTDCWQFNADSRPEFHEIVDEMEMRLDLAEDYISLHQYNINNYYFVDHVSMSDLDLDQSDDGLVLFNRSRSKRSIKQSIDL